MAKEKKYPLSTHELKYIHGKKYRPNIPNIFIEEDGLTYLNIAVPTELMMQEGKPENEPKAILDILFNLLGDDYDNLQYFINWIAVNFVFGIKPQVAIALFGLEGTGKGILYYIMEQL